MGAELPILAGMVSTAIFAGSTLPMLHKAARTRELASYSLGNLALANVGNAVHSLYVFTLPPGPIWLLHSFYVISAALMLYWFLRYGGPHRCRGGRRSAAAGPGASYDALTRSGPPGPDGRLT